MRPWAQRSPPRFSPPHRRARRNASLTVTGSTAKEALTLTVNALTDQAHALGKRRMGEILALATNLSGSVDTDKQADT